MVRKTYPPPFSLRLTFEERAQLEIAAGEMPWSEYIRLKVFDGRAPKRQRGKRPVQDRQALGQLLGKLGTSHLANNLNQLARAANSGSLRVTPDIEATLRQSYAEIRWMRMTLMAALGLQDREGDLP